MAGRQRVAYTLMQCWHRVPGGTATAALALAGALIDRDDVELVGVGPWGNTVPGPPFSPPAGLPIRRLRAPYQALYDVWHHSRFLRPESVTGPVDVVHATASTVPSRGPTPLVVTLHDLFPILEPAVLTRRGARILSRGIELARRHADIVCCSSAQTLDDCVSAGFDPRRLRLVPLGVHKVDVSPADRERVRREHGLDRDYLLWVGTIEPRKNLGVLLEAFRLADLDDVDLVIVGPTGWNEDLASLVGPSGDRVRTLGFVPQRDLAPLYRDAIALMLPSRREGFGLPALEAMSQATPVIGSRGTAVEEVVGDGGIVVDPDDVVGFATAMDDLVSDRSRRDRLGLVGVGRADQYSWERSAELTVAAYRDATS